MLNLLLVGVALARITLVEARVVRDWFVLPLACKEPLC